jgi:inner membrane protein
VDPFFSLPAGIACLALIFLRSDHYRRVTWAKAGITFTAIYLIYGLYNKIEVSRDIREMARRQQISYGRSFNTPSPFNTWLWFVALEKEDGYYVGYRSYFDHGDSLHLRWFPRNEHMLDSIDDHHELDNLKRFSQGFYTVEKKNDTLIFNDLRFGQEIGWHDPSQPFAFHYYLSHPEGNELVVQRGRFAQWNATTMKTFLRRIIGQ